MFMRQKLHQFRQALIVLLVLVFSHWAPRKRGVRDKWPRLRYQSTFSLSIARAITCADVPHLPRLTLPHSFSLETVFSRPPLNYPVSAILQRRYAIFSNNCLNQSLSRTDLRSSSFSTCSRDGQSFPIDISSHFLHSSSFPSLAATQAHL